MKDVNQTRYHLVLGATDWGRSQPVGAKQWEYDPTRQGIQLQAEVFTFQTQRTAPPLNPEQRRDSDRDPYGHRYWIDATGTQIWVQWAAAQTAEVLFPAAAVDCPPPAATFRPAVVPTEPAPEPLAGLAVLPDGYLVVGSPTTGSLLVFDLYALDAGFLRLPIAPGMAPRPAPFDLAALPDGGLLLLDRTHQTVWRFNRHLRPVPVPETAPGTLTPFQPRMGRSRYLTSPPTLTPVELHGSTVNPIAIAPLPDGAFWILDQPATGASVLWYYPLEGMARSLPLRTENLVDPDADDLNLALIRGYDLAYLPNATPGENSVGTLFMAEIAGNQAFALGVVALEPLTLRIERHYYPLRNFSPVSLIADGQAGEVFYQQPGTAATGAPRPRWLPIKALPRQRYETETRLVPRYWDGTTEQPWDGKEPNCVWHRLCLDACIPPETQVQVETRVAEQPDELAWATWQVQPAPYRRPTSEVPYSPLWNPEELTDPHTGTWELLLQGMQGRYLDVRLTLSGNGRSTPLIRALRLHYPRFSYLREYLPQVYQQEASSLSFLDRFLANPEGIFTVLEGLIAQVQTLMDVHTVPTEALDWLASWIGLALEPGWSDHQRRLLIAQAPYFFQRRGTTVGLLQAILLTIYPQLGPRIFRDDVASLCPTVRIVERFLTRTLSGTAAGDPTDPSPPTGTSPTRDAASRAHRFVVMVPTTLTPTTQTLVERIVNLEKPAHTAFTLKPYWALFRVGDVRLGLDTVLGRGGQFDHFQLGQSALAEAVLSESFPYTLTHRTVISR